MTATLTPRDAPPEVIGNVLLVKGHGMDVSVVYELVSFGACEPKWQVNRRVVPLQTCAVEIEA